MHHWEYSSGGAIIGSGGGVGGTLFLTLSSLSAVVFFFCQFLLFIKTEVYRQTYILQVVT